jgi:hypothetical protein
MKLKILFSFLVLFIVNSTAEPIVGPIIGQPDKYPNYISIRELENPNYSNPNKVREIRLIALEIFDFLLT